MSTWPHSVLYPKNAFPVFYSFLILKSFDIFSSAFTVTNLLSKLNSNIPCTQRCYLPVCVHHQLSQSNILTLKSSWYQYSSPQLTSYGTLLLLLLSRFVVSDYLTNSWRNMCLQRKELQSWVGRARSPHSPINSGTSSWAGSPINHLCKNHYI